MLETVCVIIVFSALFLAITSTSRSDDTGQNFFYDRSDGERYPHKWGYTDTRFEFDGPRSVRVTGSRYPLAGFSMPYFIPFVEDVLQLPINPEEMVTEKEEQAVPTPLDNSTFLTAVGAALAKDQISREDRERLIHSHGQLSVDEIYRLLYGEPLERIVDLVLYPENDEDVATIVRLADEHGVCLVPYGGGTNVSGALTCPAGEQRAIVSVDMRRMNHIMEIDEENFQAVVEAGISGKELERELDRRGYTSGHDPDSVELSTLGGWIATNASGMKKNKYGNIEDIVVEATLVTPTGDIETRHTTPRNSVGIQPRLLLFGSEGNLGIITRATIKIHPKPARCEYGSLVFPTFTHGVTYLKALRQTGVLPASIRLVNNNEFRLGQSLKSKPSFLESLSAAVQKFVLLKLFRFDAKAMAACTIVMEGETAEVTHQKRTLFALAKKHRGKSGGSHSGRRGYTLTFGIAYIRDFFNQFHFLGETFETSVPWNCIHNVCQAVERELASQCEKYAILGRPYLSYRVTQTYHTGVCIYFTMGMSGKQLRNPEEVYHAVEHHLRQTILDHGGSLSHHHGIGKIRQPFLPQVHSPNSMDALRHTKDAVDPHNVFGIRNGIFTEPS